MDVVQKLAGLRGAAQSRLTLAKVALFDLPNTVICGNCDSAVTAVLFFCQLLEKQSVLR